MLSCPSMAQHGLIQYSVFSHPPACSRSPKKESVSLSIWSVCTVIVRQNPRSIQQKGGGRLENRPEQEVAMVVAVQDYSQTFFLLVTIHTIMHRRHAILSREQSICVQFSCFLFYHHHRRRNKKRPTTKIQNVSHALHAEGRRILMLMTASFLFGATLLPIHPSS